jgi:hypothetical protein
MRGNTHALIVAARFACALSHRSGGSALRTWLFSCCCLVWNAAARLVDCPVRDPAFFARDFFTLPHRPFGDRHALASSVFFECLQLQGPSREYRQLSETYPDRLPRRALRLACMTSWCALRHHPLPRPLFAMNADLR